MEMEIQLTNLVTALEKATQMAKHLPSAATDSAHVYAALHDAHRHLSLFLAHTERPQPSSDIIDDNDDDASMQLADEEQQVADGATEEDSKMTTIETVEERMKDCSLHNANKRRKRSLSPFSLAAGDLRRSLGHEIELDRAQVDYDPHFDKLRAFDLIYQFHS